MTTQFHRDFFPEKRERSTPVDVPRPTLSGERTAWAETALTSEVERLAQAPEGTRNDQLNTAAFNLGQIVAGGYLDHGEVWQALALTARAIGLDEGEIRATLASGLGAAAEHPRQPNELTPIPEPTVLTTLDSEPVQAGVDLGVQYPALDWHELWSADVHEEWIVEPLIPARRLVALFSPPKMGKSLLLLDLAQCVARGAPFLGHPTAREDASGVDKGRTVLYVDHENDPHGDIRPRLEAMGVQPGMLDRLKYLSFPSMPFLDTPMGGLVLLEVAKHYGAELVIIDTISRAVGGEENDNDTWLAFYRNTGKHLKAAGIACVRLDHTGKDHTKGMRGGSAKYGDVDAVWAMTMPSESVVRLECTANRLPISEKVIEVTRQRDPLRHVVDPTAVERGVEANVQRARRWLEEHHWPRDGSNGSGPGPLWMTVRGDLLTVDHAIRKYQWERALHDHQRALPVVENTDDPLRFDD